MGSTSINGKFPGFKKWLAENMPETDNLIVLDHAIINKTDGWVVIKHKKTLDQFACVVHIQQYKNEYVTKCITEMEGPVLISIPEKLFNKLTPLSVAHEYSDAWRNRVRDRIKVESERKEALKVGTVFKYAGYVYTIEDITELKGRNGDLIVKTVNGARLRMKQSWYMVEATIISVGV